MAKFNIEITEIWQNVFEIEAVDLESAIKIAKDKYSRCEIELYTEDIKQTTFCEYDVAERNISNGGFSK